MCVCGGGGVIMYPTQSRKKVSDSAKVWKPTD